MPVNIDRIRDLKEKGGAAIRSKWNRVKATGAVATVVYYTVNPVRRPDGSIDAEATAIRVYNATRGIVKLPAYPVASGAWEEASGVQFIENADGSLTITQPMWLHDP